MPLVNSTLFPLMLAVIAVLLFVWLERRRG
jgi:hypothetical protein